MTRGMAPCLLKFHVCFEGTRVVLGVRTHTANHIGRLAHSGLHFWLATCPLPGPRGLCCLMVFDLGRGRVKFVQ